MDKSRLSLMTFPMAFDLWKRKMSIKDTLAVAGQAGIPCVDVMHVRKNQIDAYTSAMRQTGVQVYTYMITTSFLRNKWKWENDIRKGLKTASALGAKYLMIVPYDFLNRSKAMKLGRDAVKQCMIAGFRKAVELAKDSDISVCFETTPHDLSCLSGTEDCLDVLNAVPGLQFVFDTANMLPHGDDPVEAYEKLKGRISHVHLKDVILTAKGQNRGYAEIAADGRQMQVVVWGEGIIPVRELYDQMITDGYTGYFAIEYVHPDGGACGVEMHTKQLDRFFRN